MLVQILNSYILLFEFKTVNLNTITEHPLILSKTTYKTNNKTKKLPSKQPLNIPTSILRKPFLKILSLSKLLIPSLSFFFDKIYKKTGFS